MLYFISSHTYDCRCTLLSQFKVLSTLFPTPHLSNQGKPTHAGLVSYLNDNKAPELVVPLF